MTVVHISVTIRAADAEKARPTRTDPRVLGVDDLDRCGRDIPALQRLLASPVELNVFADGMG